MPALFEHLSRATQPPDEDFIDVDYWADPERNIRRKSGEQETILAATSACSKAEMADAGGRTRLGICQIAPIKPNA
jgi:hypothetical protein